MALAGLMHDLGKIGQPAGAELSEEVRRIAEHFCPPTADGSYSHKHVLYTAEAILTAKNDFGDLSRDDSFLRLAAAHHNPDAGDFDQCVLQKADWLASGHDRKLDLFESADPIFGLRPALAVISGEFPYNDPQWTVPTKRLNFEPSLSLPRANASKEGYTEDCQRLWKVLTDRLKVEFRHAAGCVEDVYYLLADVGGNVPSSRSRGQNPDINLFDHSRLVAAFASCLAALHSQGPADANQIHGRYRFLGLSLGGIQSYLFHDVPPVDAAPGSSGQRGIARTLRARSFIVGLMGWLLPHKILDSIDFPIVHNVFEAGGRSLLLLPDDPDVIRKVDGAIKLMDREIDKLTRGGLRFDFAWSDSLNDSAFSGSCFAETYGTFMRQVNTSRNRIPSFLKDNGKWSEDEWVMRSLDDDGFDRHLADLGRALPRARYLVLDTDQRTGELFTIDLLGYRISLMSTQPARGRWFELLPSSAADRTPSRFLLLANHVRIATTKDCDEESELDATTESGEASSSETEDDRLKPGDVIPFETLALMSTNDAGETFRHPMLGVLKADVDNLGQILTNGLGDQTSLGRFAGVSRTLDQFFRGFLTQRLRDHFSSIYTVYAGGDDLFLIGPWFDVVRFSVDLHNNFQALKCQNPNITFSAGLVFCKPTTPVRQIARFAEQSLELSKNSGKDRISLGDLSMQWDTFRLGVNRSALLRELMDSQYQDGGTGVVPGMVYRLLQYSKMALRCLASKCDHASAKLSVNASDWKWRSQLNYDLKRNLKHDLQNESVAELRAWLLSLTSESTHEVAALYTAATLALYQQRGE